MEAQRNGIRLIIIASALGSMFEWYDFFLYGTLAALLGRLFFSTAGPEAGLLLALATFGVGFAVRPIGAIVFGVLGDRLGRKHTFIVTITLMGAATAGIGMLPTSESIGLLAPVLLVGLRALQGFALGGEYGGASIYVAEHVPARRRGYYTSLMQAGVPAGLLLSLAVSTAANWLSGEAYWAIWGWRLPFLFSLILLGVSLWIRLKLAESPVFEAMKRAGTTAANPLRESVDSWPKVKRLLIAFAVTAGQSVGAYMALFQGMYFLQNSLHVAANVVRVAALIAAASGIGTYILCGWLSDTVGRKRPIVIGFILTVLLLFPLFHLLAAVANPTLALGPVTPSIARIVLIALVLMILYAIAALTYGPIAAMLVELFPARVRYTSLSIPYHFANGYAGGFLPLISQYIVMRTGNPFSGLWYPVSIAMLALLVSLFFLPETLGQDPDSPDDQRTPSTRR